MTITPATQAAIYAYTAGVERARRDYRLRPASACSSHGCDQLADPGRSCRFHRRSRSRRNAA